MASPPRRPARPGDDPLEALRRSAPRRVERPGTTELRTPANDAADILADVAVVLASSSTLTDILNKIVDGIMRVTGCQRGFVMLRESDGGFSTFTGRYADQSEWSETSARATSGSVRDLVVETREPFLASDLTRIDELKSSHSIQEGGILSAVCLPMLYRERLIGVIYADSTRLIPHPLDGMTQLLNAFALQAAFAIERAHGRGELSPGKAVRREEPVGGVFRFGRMVSREPVMGRLFDDARLIAGGSLSVLIQGETGTGKEVFANAIHDASPRAGRRFVSINAAGMPDELVSSILFGHKRGTFTTAIADREGLFELADGGTLFLDEVGDMPLGTQIKLLRVLETQEVERVGDEGNPRRVDVRVIAATHRNLSAAVISGAFREDLLNRLRRAPLYMPPLRERRADVIALALEFLQQCAAAQKIPVPEFSRDARARLRANEWSGNIRMLKAAVELSVSFRDADNVIGADAIGRLFQEPETERRNEDRGRSHRELMDAFEAELILRKLEENGHNITKTAESLGLSRQMLHQKIKKHGIRTRDD